MRNATCTCHRQKRAIGRSADFLADHCRSGQVSQQTSAAGSAGSAGSAGFVSAGSVSFGASVAFAGLTAGGSFFCGRRFLAERQVPPARPSSAWRQQNRRRNRSKPVASRAAQVRPRLWSFSARLACLLAWAGAAAFSPVFGHGARCLRNNRLQTALTVMAYCEPARIVFVLLVDKHLLDKCLPAYNVDRASRDRIGGPDRCSSSWEVLIMNRKPFLLVFELARRSSARSGMLGQEPSADRLDRSLRLDRRARFRPRHRR